MPVTQRDRADVAGDDIPDISAVLGHINTASFLFDEEDKKHNSATSPDVKSYLQMNTTNDKFPILVRRDGDGNGGVQLSASSAALDLALSQSPGPEGPSNVWPTATRHRHAQQSLPVNTFRHASFADDYDQASSGNQMETPRSLASNSNRRSLEYTFSSPFAAGDSKRSSYQATPSSGPSSSSASGPKLQPSLSTNNVPTLKQGNGINPHAEQHLHKHEASLGRVRPGAMSNRNSRELSGGFRDAEGGGYRPPASFQPSMHSFAGLGGNLTSGPAHDGLVAPYADASALPDAATPTNASSAGGYYPGAAMNALTAGMHGMQLGQAPVWANMAGLGGAQHMYGGGAYVHPFATYGPRGLHDSQARVIASRRLQSNDNARFVNIDLLTMTDDEVFALCKDQHGCRQLQRKLEDRDPESMRIIFQQTSLHIIELMTGALFGLALSTLADAYRPVRQLPLPEAARVQQRRAAQPARAQRGAGAGLDRAEPARHACAAEDDRVRLDARASEFPVHTRADDG